MCLYFEKLVEPNDEERDALKFLRWSPTAQRFVTPTQNTLVDSQSIIAVGRTRIRRNNSTYRPEYDLYELHGGAIHCYKMDRIRKHILRTKTSALTALFQVLGRGIIAENGTEIAFREIVLVNPIAASWSGYMPQAEELCKKLPVLNSVIPKGVLTRWNA